MGPDCPVRGRQQALRPIDSVISAVLPGALIMAKNSTTPNVKS